MVLGSALVAAKSEIKKSQLSSVVKSDVYTQQYGEWEYKCFLQRNKSLKKANIKKNCEVTQSAKVKQGNKLVRVLSLAVSQVIVKGQNNKESKQLALTVLTPLNVLLPSGFVLSPSKGEPSSFSYRNCNQAGCWVYGLIGSKLLLNLNKSNNAVGKVRLINGRNVNIKFSLKGISAALTALRSGALPKNKVTAVSDKNR